MFAGLENVQAHPRRGWTALVSFTLQAAAVATAIAVSILYPNSLPDALARRRIFVPISENVVRPVASTQSRGGGQTGVTLAQRPIIVARDNGVHFGPPMPQQSSDVGPEAVLVPGVYTSSGTPLGDIPPAAVRPVPAKPPRISAMMQGNLLHRIEPIYPPIAKATGVQGSVLIKAVISRDGNIEQAQVLSGSPLLYPAALEAVRHWKYRPYVLNGAPIEVETEITVNFVLSRWNGVGGAPQ